MIKRIGLVLFVAFILGGLAVIATRPNEQVVKVDTILTIDSDSSKINLIDENGNDVGSVSFDDEVTVTIKRLKK